VVKLLIRKKLWIQGFRNSFKREGIVMKQVLQDYLNHLRLGEAQRYRNMAVFPLLCDKEGE
jgi:hypothetical protein